MSVGLIDFLRNWGESLFTSKKAFISTQASIDCSHVLQIDGVDEYTAPADGAVCAYINDLITSGPSGFVSSIINDTTIQQMTYAINESGYKTLWQPVKKGDKVMFNRRTESPKNWAIKFYPTIGGG